MDKIVGGILTSDYIDDQAGRRIECVGEIYTSVSNDAALAYRLMKRGVVKQVSMECTFREGECSICGKKFTERTTLCTHLKNFKGGEFKGKPCYEILHDVTFQGVALLDKPGADVNAKILQVAALDTAANESCKEVAKAADADVGEAAKPDSQEIDMDPKDHEAAVATAVADALKQATEAHASSTAALDARIAELTTANEALAAENAAFKQQIADAEAATKKSARQAKAEVLVKKMADAKMFKSDEERAAELTRLADLDEPLYLATEAATERALAVTLATSTDDAATQAATAAACAEQQRAEAALRAKPGESTRASDVGDKGPESLTDKLCKFTLAKED
jgi:adenine-specific DNA-methyltransferase